MAALIVIIVYIVFHLPAFILLSVGLSRLKDKPKSAKVMLIIAGVYFLIGAGICGSIMGAF